MDGGRFCQRHPEVTLRTPAPLSFSRAIASDRESINSYFDLLEETLLENNILNKPSNIFNLDESGFPLNPRPLKVLCRKGSRNPVHLTGDCKAQVTVLACTSATGYALPPFVIYDRKTLNPEYTIGEVPGTIYGLSQNGWMDKELFSDWFFHHFLPYAPPSRPLLLLMDGIQLIIVQKLFGKLLHKRSSYLSYHQTLPTARSPWTKVLSLHSR